MLQTQLVVVNTYSMPGQASQLITSPL